MKEAASILCSLTGISSLDGSPMYYHYYNSNEKGPSFLSESTSCVVSDSMCLSCHAKDVFIFLQDRIQASPKGLGMDNTLLEDIMVDINAG
ncbi:conserved hypothetical protein [Ricinus communis]|uniref:Uncharacterized protein n=1 Tax=Ricinus communis TaxID=3988 RepID=B9RQY1_RICCO|nr:conserved hypothetical protein [Ricinus communis]